MTPRIRVRQETRPHLKKGAPTGLWDWSMWIEPVEGQMLDSVRRVMYSLHPAFPNPNRVVRNPARGFRLEVSSDSPMGATWGTFTVRVRVVFQDGTFERHEARLRFDSPRVPVRPLLDMSDDDSFADRQTLVKRLKGKGAFGYAREALERLPDANLTDAEREWVIQQRALCTYKDPLLPFATRLARALEILEGCAGRLAATADPETLGLAGAIFKRQWEVDGQRTHLERSFEYYRRGFDEMLERGQARADYDGGAFTGVNAAFVADLLAAEAAPNSALHAAMLAHAQNVRQRLVSAIESLPAQNWWTLNSLAQTHLAQASTDPSMYAAARARLARALEEPDVPEWELETTATQLLALVDTHSRLWPSDRDRIVRNGYAIVSLLYRGRPLRETTVRGKMGLALSGGGFRASLFHIGVLARLAELDLLRHVEVLSCVSGGSIVGAYYYLELKHLLEKKRDAEIQASDYVEIVRRMERQFLSGVQDNIRVRLAASLEANWKMLLRPRRYSRTRRIGELYEEHLFSRVEDGERGAVRWLNELFISPLGAEDRTDDGFSPKLHNWRRQAKVPILVLNATTLNAGRNFQFTASAMGEAPSYGNEIDATPQLNAVYYSEAPARHQDVRLGHAVAASSCVPGLFDPLVLEELYPDRVVRLVDGGVHDNQGARALLDQDCTVLFISDASGQMSEDLDPGQAALGVLLRTNGVLQARLRVAQHQEIDARRRGGLAREVLFAHMKEELAQPPVDPLPFAVDERQRADGDETSYGVRKDVQRALAGIRTDLDSFTDVEAYALMTSGYRIAERVVAQSRTLGAAAPVDTRHPWQFLAIEPAMCGGDAAGWSHAHLLRHLRVAARLGFKVWALDPVLRILGWMLLGGAVAGLAAWAIMKPVLQVQREINLRSLLIVVAIAVLGCYWQAGGQLAGWIKKLIDYRSTLMRIAGGFAMGTVGWALAGLHLVLFDARFKQLGRVSAQPRAAVPLLARERSPVPGAEAHRMRARVRPQRSALAALGVAAGIVGVLPFVRFLDLWSRPALVGLALGLGLALAVAFLSLDSKPSEATEVPGPGEWVLGWFAALQEGAVAGLMALIFYAAFDIGGRGWNALAGAAGWALTVDPATVALRMSVVFGTLFALSGVSMAVHKLQRTLYPSTAGARSAYFSLLDHPRRIALLAAPVAVAYIVLLTLFPGGWGMTAAAALLVYAGVPLDKLDRRVTAAGRSRITAAAAQALEGGGYTVIPSPRTGNPEVDPLIDNVTLVASAGSSSYAIEVKDLGKSKARLEWNAASAVRTAATVLQQEMWVQSAASPRVHPVLLVAGGEISAGLRRFSSAEGVSLVHVSALESARGAAAGKDELVAALTDAGIPLPASSAASQAVQS